MGGQYDSSNKEHVANKRKRSALEAKKAADDLNYVMSDPRGRRFMWRLLKKCRLYEISFTGNSTTFFNDGHRNVGLQVLAELQEHAMPEYQRMERENLNKSGKDDV